MKAKVALVKDNFDAKKIYTFNLIPCNEGHSMTYLETCKGNLENLIARCDEIVKGLKSIFPLGNFTVLIENPTFDNYVSYIPLVGILDNNGNILLKFYNSK